MFSIAPAAIGASANTVFGPYIQLLVEVVRGVITESAFLALVKVMGLCAAPLVAANALF